MDTRKAWRLRFEPPVGEGETLVGRTHPIVGGLANQLIDSALDPQAQPIARRAGVIRTASVTRRTTALLLRLRFDLRTRTRGTTERSAIAEEIRIAGFAGDPGEPDWLDPAAADALLDLAPTGNVLPEQGRDAIERLLGGLEDIRPALERLSAERAADLQVEHDRVRQVAALRGRTDVVPQLPVDVLGIYVFLPVPRI